MTTKEIITWAGRVADIIVMAAHAHVYLGYTRLDTQTPRSLTAVGQRRTTTVANRTSLAGRGATTTITLTGRTAELITVVRIPTHSTDTNIISTR